MSMGIINIFFYLMLYSLNVHTFPNDAVLRKVQCSTKHLLILDNGGGFSLLNIDTYKSIGPITNRFYIDLIKNYNNKVYCSVINDNENSLEFGLLLFTLSSNEKNEKDKNNGEKVLYIYLYKIEANENFNRLIIKLSASKNIEGVKKYEVYNDFLIYIQREINCNKDSMKIISLNTNRKCCTNIIDIFAANEKAIEIFTLDINEKNIIPSCKDIFYMENNKVYQYDGNISKSLDYIQQRPNYICPADNGDYIFISESILGENLNIVYNSGQISNLINNLDFKTQSIAYVREKNLILILQRSILSDIFITLYLYEGKRIIPNSTNKIFTYKLTEEKAKYYNKIDYYKQGSDDNEDNRSKNEYILISDKCASNILVYQLDLMNDPKPLLSKIKIDSYEIEDFENIGNDILIIANNLKYKIDLGSYHTTFEKINTNDKIRKLIKYIPNDNDNGT
ncbi:MAG: hypothetical protein QXM07_09655, partial [Nitrososphaerota archaeon]